MAEWTQTLEKLCEASKKDYANPYLYPEWPESLKPEEHWFTSPELVSLYGTPTYDRLSEAEKKRLSFYEAVNFFSLNIHGEKPLVEGLAHRLYLKNNKEINPYLHHFLDEENKHMIYFGGFCLRYAGKIYPDKKMVFPREYAPGEEDFLFFAKVLIFEEIVDVYNVRMLKDERLHPVAREINRLHHKDEARHLVFGRQYVKATFDQYLARWKPETVQGVRDYLVGYLTATWKEYYNPDVYRDAGLPDPYAAMEEAWNDANCRTHREKVTEGCLRYLLENKILTGKPAL